VRNFPPRIVSRKCTCQVSAEFALPIDAAMPPSAITVCLAEQGLAKDGGAHSEGAGLDRRP
jgi:hypothetical protein